MSIDHTAIDDMFRDEARYRQLGIVGPPARSGLVQHHRAEEMVPARYFSRDET